MIRVRPVRGAEDDVPDDKGMRLIEVGLAILAFGSAAMLTLIR